MTNEEIIAALTPLAALSIPEDFYDGMEFGEEMLANTKADCPEMFEDNRSDEHFVKDGAVRAARMAIKTLRQEQLLETHEYCKVCGECAKCDLRPCRDGGKHQV
jgi:hypothetical protein